MGKFDSLKENFLKNKILVENFTFLSLLQVSNLILFLITIPYLFRVLGSQNYGLIVFAQTIAFYFTILINFGYNLTATRDISVNRDQKEKVAEIFSSVLQIKIFLFFLAFLAMIIMLLLINELANHWKLFVFSMLACLSEALFPLWYFQGTEKMKYITLINVSTRVIATIMVFIVIIRQEQFFIYPLLLGAGTMTGAIVGLGIVLGKHKIKFRFQPFVILKRYFIGNLLYFFSNISTQIYLNANRIIIGSLLGMVSLAYYDVAEKVITMAKVPYSLLGQTLFPWFAREKNIKVISRIMLFTIIFTLFLIIGIFAVSEKLTFFLSGSTNQETVTVLRILSLSLVPISVSMFFGDLFMVNSNMKVQYARMRFFGLLFYLTCFLILYLSGNLSLIKLALIVVTVEVFMTAYSFLVYRKNSIMKL